MIFRLEFDQFAERLLRFIAALQAVEHDTQIVQRVGPPRTTTPCRLVAVHRVLQAPQGLQGVAQVIVEPRVVRVVLQTALERTHRQVVIADRIVEGTQVVVRDG